MIIRLFLWVVDVIFSIIDTVLFFRPGFFDKRDDISTNNKRDGENRVTAIAMHIFIIMAILGVTHYIINEGQLA